MSRVPEVLLTDVFEDCTGELIEIWQDGVCKQLSAVASLQLRPIGMDKAEPEAEKLVFQSVQASAAFVRLGFGDGHDALDKMQLLQGVQISHHAVQAGSLLDFIQLGSARSDSLEHGEVVSGLAKRLTNIRDPLQMALDKIIQIMIDTIILEHDRV